MEALSARFDSRARWRNFIGVGEMGYRFQDCANAITVIEGIECNETQAMTLKFAAFFLLASLSGTVHAQDISGHPVLTDKPVMILSAGHEIEERSIEDLSLMLVQAAHMATNGDIYIANTSAGKVERVRGNVVDTVLTSINRNGVLNIYSDLTISEGGTILVLDGEVNRRIISLDPDTGATSVVAKAPDLDGDVFWNISSVTERGGKLLIAARPAIMTSQTQARGAGDSTLFVVSKGEWSQVATGETVGSPGATIRDAVFTDDGYAFLADNFFVLLEKNGTYRKIDLGTHWGGGIIPYLGGWLVGAYTGLRHIDPDLTEHKSVRVKTSFGNVGHLSWTPNSTILLSDTDRSTVYELSVNSRTGDLDILRAMGNQSSSMKMRAISSGNDGKLLLLDGLTPRLLSYNPADGAVNLIAGTGKQGPSGEKPADEFDFLFPNAVVQDRSGAIYVAEANYRIVRIENGNVEIFAGDVHQGIPAHGQHRLEAKFRSLRGLDLLADGSLLVVDQGNHSLYRISPGGHIEVLMGTGEAGVWVEGKAAKGQPLNYPYAVLARASGVILIADSYNHAIVEIGVDGIARRFAGQVKFTTYQGLGDHVGDGGHARDAGLNTPRGLSEDSEGNVYIVDQFNHAIRKVAPSGVITNVAGGTFGYDATPSRLSYPLGAIRIGDHLFIADTGNNVTWAIPLSSPDATVE